MATKFTPDETKKVLMNAVRKGYVPQKVKDTLREKGLSKLLHTSASKTLVLKTVKALQEEGVVLRARSARTILHEAEKKFEPPAPKATGPGPLESQKEAILQKEQKRAAVRVEAVREGNRERTRTDRLMEEQKADAAAEAATAAKAASASRQSSLAASEPAKPIIDLPID